MTTIPALLEPIENRLKVMSEPPWFQWPSDAIAASPTDTARLLAAVKAVTKLHKPGPGYLTTDVACQTCSNSIGYVLYPCETVSAVEAALRSEA